MNLATDAADRPSDLYGLLLWAAAGDAGAVIEIKRRYDSTEGDQSARLMLRLAITKSIVRLNTRLAESLYAQTKNPLIVWHVVRQCGELNDDLPEWVLSALAAWAGALLAIAERPPKDNIAKAAGEALGFKTNAKGESAFKAYYHRKYTTALADAFLSKQGLGLSGPEARRELAEESGIDNKSLDRWLKKRMGEELGSLSRYPNLSFLEQILADK